MGKKQEIEELEKELEEKVKKAEEKFFISLDLSEFPSMNDIIFNKEAKEIVSNWITKIVWYILKKDGKLVTLTQSEQNLIEMLTEKESSNYNKINRELQKSFTNNKGKSIKEYIYDKEFYNLGQYDENYNTMEDSYKNNIQYEKDFIPDSRVNDVIDKLQLLLFGGNGKKGFFEVFYEEYGEISNAQEEFINFCRKIIRENIFVSRIVQNQNNFTKKIISFEVKKIFKEDSIKTVVRCIIKKGKKEIEKEIENVIKKEGNIRVKRGRNILLENINFITITKLNNEEYDVEIEKFSEIQKSDIIEFIETSNMKSYIGRKYYHQEDEDNMNYEGNEREDDNMEEFRQTNDMNDKLIKFLLDNNEEISNIILKELLQNNLTNKTEEIKRYLIVFFKDYKNLISSDILESPSNMRVFTLLEKYFGEQETKQMKNEIQNFSQKEKQEWIKNQLDPLCFWKNFYNKYKEDINCIDYKKESKKLKTQNESRVKENIVLKIRDIIVNYSISNDISIKKEEIEIILSILRRLMLKTGGNLTKLEINEVANKISTYNPCEKYKDYIKYSVFGFIGKQKEIEEHIKKCKNCRSYKDYISESKTAREKRNKNVLKIVKTNPYIVEQELTEESYKDINYLKKQFRENPCETNFYYLVSAYIKEGNQKHAEKLLTEGFILYKENIFMKEQ